MSDDIFVQGEVRISRTIAAIGGVSYPVNGITSVYISRKSFSIKALIGGALTALVGIAILPSNAFFGIIVLIVGAAIIFSAFVRPYRLMLRTASGETQALEHKDATFIGSIKSAIETAVVQRG